MEIYRKFSFEAAHRLPKVPDGHKCARLHGHSFQITIFVDAPVDEAIGWVIDFADIGRAVDPIIDQLDHRYLNEIDGLENPTSEILARWLWQKIKPNLPELDKVEVAETCRNGCIYRGENA